jgi:hypothetical protein
MSRDPQESICQHCKLLIEKWSFMAHWQHAKTMRELCHRRRTVATPTPSSNPKVEVLVPLDKVLEEIDGMAWVDLSPGVMRLRERIVKKWGSPTPKPTGGKK